MVSKHSLTPHPLALSTTSHVYHHSKADHVPPSPNSSYRTLLKGKVLYSINQHWAQSWSRSIGSQNTGNLSHKPGGIGCHYFPPGLWLLSQPKRSPHSQYSKLAADSLHFTATRKQGSKEEDTLDPQRLNEMTPLYIQMNKHQQPQQRHDMADITDHLVALLKFSFLFRQWSRELINLWAVRATLHRVAHVGLSQCIITALLLHDNQTHE